MVDMARFPWYKPGLTYKEGLDNCRKYYDFLDKINVGPFKAGMAIPCDDTFKRGDTFKIEYNPLRVTKMEGPYDHRDTNGWPCLGRYIGTCPTERSGGMLFCPPELLDAAISLLESDYQSRRVYQDELDALNGGEYRLQRKITNNNKEASKC